MLEPFLLCRCVVVELIVLRSPEDARGLHSTAPFGAEDTLDHDSSVHLEELAVVANPILLWKLIDAVALLMDRNIADVTENDEVLVLIVTVVADGALGVVLHHQAPLGSAEGVVAVEIQSFRGSNFFVAGLQLLQYSSVPRVIFVLLP